MALEQAERGRQKRLNDEQEGSRTSRKARGRAERLKHKQDGAMNKKKDSRASMMAQRQAGWNKEQAGRLKATRKGGCAVLLIDEEEGQDEKDGRSTSMTRQG
jgi:hypothetical protein